MSGQTISTLLNMKILIYYTPCHTIVSPLFRSCHFIVMTGCYTA